MQMDIVRASFVCGNVYVCDTHQMCMCVTHITRDDRLPASVVALTAVFAVCCSVLQCVDVCCSVLQCVAVCCSVLQCVAVCCSVLQCVALRPKSVALVGNVARVC